MSANGTNLEPVKTDDDLEDIYDDIDSYDKLSEVYS